ncbi:MAG TPA: hypothetical protein GYA07_10030 [Verrucomicrobia bacterium]|nr:hypothetical protein [Verrucomicrobiota bacterium]HOP97161.1 hypothetical protein [Verrucomicrobiota bacterium]
MAEQARVTSIEAIEAFRSSLIVFLSKARPTLEEVSAELARTRQWLQNDQRRYWQKELALRTRKLERAQSELFSATMATVGEPASDRQMAVRRAREAVREAEEKLKAVKKWDRELENRADPLIKQVDQLHHYLTTRMTKAVAQLANVVKTLESYADIQSPAASEPPPAPPATTPDSTGKDAP